MKPHKKPCTCQVCQEARKDIAQECYLQCLAVEMGEGECGKAIRTKFHLTKYEDD